MPGWSEWLKLVELGLVLLVAAKVFGQFWQKREDTGESNMGRIADLKGAVATLENHVQDLRTINIAKRLSIIESTQENFELHVYREYMPREVCKERYGALHDEIQLLRTHGKAGVEL